MAIPETQLDTWSKQGSVTQSKSTYATIKLALESSDAPYAGKNYTIFLQGSYGNDTNIYADSDVDVLMRLDSTYYYDTSSLTEADKSSFDTGTSGASYNYNDFKRDVLAQLNKKYGSDVDPGSKAVFVKGNASRRDADVVPAALYRKYSHYRSASDQQYVEGICFWSADGTQIINYPKLHSDNCTTKHQNTACWFKPSVRILKNMRNAMIDKGYIQEGLAPSYFIEGMMYNVPANCYGTSYSATMVAAINWLRSTDRTKLVCANGQYYLQHAASPVTWREESCTKFLDSVATFWNNW